jgi:HlyD family secretion protein
MAVAAAALAIAAWQWSGSTFDGGGGGGGVSDGIRTIAASRGDLQRTLRVGGTIAARRYAAIRAPRISSGRRTGGGGDGLTLVEMAKPGSFVKAGTIVAEFDSQSQEEIIERQRAGVVQAEASIGQRTADLMIEMEALRQQLVVAQGEFHKAELDLRTAAVRSDIEAQILQAQMEEAEATAAELETEVALLSKAHDASLRQTVLERDMERIDLKRAELNAQRLVVRTPIDGIVVLQTIFRGGSFAQSAKGDEVNSGAFFMQIVDPSDMVLETVVNQADVQQLKVGQPAEIRLDAYPDRVWRGRVEAVAAIAGGGSGGGRSRAGTGNQVRSVTVSINILDSDPVIIPDLSASADVLIAAHQDVVSAPREVLHGAEDQWYVWLTGDDRSQPERRDVEVTAWTDTHVAIGKGLQQGDILTVGPVEADTK